MARHASGRNSGVLHAGFYYSADSLKARFTAEGNRAMKGFCRSRGLRLNECRKVVIARSEEELEGLYELERRGKRNGVEVRMIGEEELSLIDPNVRTFRRALYSPSTATVDPEEVCLSLRSLLAEQGVEFLMNTAFLKIRGSRIVTGRGDITAKRIVNCAGLYADRVARDFGFGKGYTIIPFKGIYLKFTGADRPLAVNVYPVPDLANPFLGVHFTVTVDGAVKIGPTAIPAFWRENYRGLERFRAGEFIGILFQEARLFLSNSFGFRDLAFAEMKKYSRRRLTGEAAGMVKRLDRSGFSEWTRPGIRAQLLHLGTRELVQDFVIEGDGRSTHVLNAVSPAFTCAFPFARHVADFMEGKG